MGSSQERSGCCCTGSGSNVALRGSDSINLLNSSLKSRSESHFVPPTGQAALAQKRLDCMAAEYAAVITAYEALQQASLTRNALFSALLFTAIAVIAELSETRKVVSGFGLAVCVIWVVALDRDSNMGQKRREYGLALEQRMKRMFSSLPDGMKEEPAYFMTLTERFWYKEVFKYVFAQLKNMFNAVCAMLSCCCGCCTARGCSFGAWCDSFWTLDAWYAFGHSIMQVIDLYWHCCLPLSFSVLLILLLVGKIPIDSDEGDMVLEDDGAAPDTGPAMAPAPGPAMPPSSSNSMQISGTLLTLVVFLSSWCTGSFQMPLF